VIGGRSVGEPAVSVRRDDPRVRTDAQRAGDSAESAVAERLTRAGWTVIGRQVRMGRLELDLVAVDPGPPRALVVLEVRYRSRRDFGLAEESLGHRKRARVREAALRLRSAGTLPDGTPLPPHPLRIDLVVVEPGSVRHHRGVL